MEMYLWKKKDTQRFRIVIITLVETIDVNDDFVALDVNDSVALVVGDWSKPQGMEKQR